MTQWVQSMICWWFAVLIVGIATVPTATICLAMWIFGVVSNWVDEEERKRRTL